MVFNSSFNPPGTDTGDIQGTRFCLRRDKAVVLLFVLVTQSTQCRFLFSGVRLCCGAGRGGWFRCWPVGEFLQAREENAFVMDFLFQKVLAVTLLLLSVQNKAGPAFSSSSEQTGREGVVAFQCLHFESLECPGLRSERKSQFAKRPPRGISCCRGKQWSDSCNVCCRTAQLEQDSSGTMLLGGGFKSCLWRKVSCR